MRIQRLNNIGIERFAQFRDSVITDGSLDQLSTFLVDSTCLEKTDADVEVELRQFTTRFEVGKYLYHLFDEVHIDNLDTDRGLWAWLAAFYFNQLCPANGNGEHRPGESARWVPEIGNFRKYYRHLLAGPYRIYRAHRDNPRRASALLATPPHQPGEIVEQLASHQQFVTNRSVMEVATRLYICALTGKPKKGAAGKERGSARRFATVLNQLELTWDLYSLSPDQLLDLLPDEFQQFKP